MVVPCCREEQCHKESSTCDSVSQKEPRMENNDLLQEPTKGCVLCSE